MTSLLLLAMVCAQETPPPPEASRRFFKNEAVDFFGDRAKRLAAAKAKESAETIWAEPVQREDGSFSIHVPPKQVVEFLNSPTEENAKAYLAWKRERLQKLQKAMETLKKVAAEETPKKQGPRSEADRAGKDESDAKETKPRTPPPPEAVTVVYFKKSG